ncbi:hypothetical protein HNR00_001332 [Methylorubrum rhodinum]|uniref:Uncharacterized protein n=1 Tax=Methylorubrum rhodinum TaxID=29428 RepID=A0A840ZFB2_9HYPH|nr:hypothetical protein [Methylorubrum rhodinum]
MNHHALSDFRNDPSVDIDDAKRLTQKARIDARTQKDVWLTTSQDERFGSDERGKVVCPHMKTPRPFGRGAPLNG